MKLIRKRRVDWQLYVLLVQREQGTMKLITGMMIDPRIGLPIGGRICRVCLASELARVANEPVTEIRISPQLRIHVRFPEKFPQGSGETATG